MNTLLITGASRGIGYATAKLFLENGWHVIGTSTSGNITIIHPEYEGYQLDLSNATSLSNLITLMKSKNINTLINNAGIGLDESDAPPINIDVLRKDLEVNLIGTVTLTENIVDKLIPGGNIINISSQMAAMNSNFHYSDPSYRISKAALNMYTLNLTVDLRVIAKGISVCSFDPGWVQTDMGGSQAPRKPEEPAHELYTLASQGFETGKFYKGLKIRNW